MADGMEFCLLGPLVVRCDGAAVPVPRGKQRVVLAALVLNANHVVSVDELAETLWGPASPASARVTVQNYVKRLRQVLGEAGRTRISTRPRGYLISVNTDEIDVSRFEALLASTRAAERNGSWGTVADQARQALALWRGEPLADVESQVLAEREVPRLVEMRLQALELRIEADMHLGGHAEVSPELRSLARAHPLRENLHALLMLALYRCGRRGEALAVYRDARQVLVETLGVEPGTGLRELHQRILTGDPALANQAPSGRPPGRQPPRERLPRELPGAVRHFVGRGDELAALTGLLEQARSTVVISAIGGTAGVGKTALALHWAHRVAERFPDGQLHVNLRGYDSGEPVKAADALAGFLRALGVPSQDIPAEESERAARYRSLLAGRQILIVLDNAGEAAQVRPLLPGTPGCVAVVTSRDPLSGLVARDGAERLDLDLLPLPDAISLLKALIGARVDADPAAAAELAERCARLPLALRVAAELAAGRPAVPLADLLGDLADQRRLDLLDVGGDASTAVRTVFSWSYRQLDADTARAFRLAGLHPGADLGRSALAALAGTTIEQADHVLGVLTRAYLIQATGSGRHGLHDLLRAYARELAQAQDTEQERRTALTRLFDHYLRTATAAMESLFPADNQSATINSRVTDQSAARAWLDAERACLVTVTAYMAAHGWPGHATALAATLFRYLDAGGYFSEAIAIHGSARAAARLTGDRRAEANAVISLGLSMWWQDRYPEAIGHYEQALALFGETGDLVGQARALNSLGLGMWWQDRYPEAIGHYEQALALFGETGDLAGQARTLNNLAMIDFQQGRYRQSADRLQLALDLHREVADRIGEGRDLMNLGLTDMRQGRRQRARSRLEQALALCDETGDQAGRAQVLNGLGDVDLREGRYASAADHQRQSIAVCREIYHKSGEAIALNGLGEVSLATGNAEDARVRHLAALDLAVETGEKREQARAHDGLARAYHADGDHGTARRHGEEALGLYVVLGDPEADRLRARLHLD